MLRKMKAISKNFLLSLELRRIKGMSLLDLFPGIENTAVDFKELRYLNGVVSTPPTDLFCICAIAKYLVPSAIFEIGTSHGVTTTQLAANTNGSTKIYTLDLEDEGFTREYIKPLGKRIAISEIKHQMGVQFKGTVLENKITSLRGDSYDFNFEPYYGKIDLVFVDGKHSFEYVQRDSENALKMLSTRGVILWHDFYFSRGVRRFLNHLSSNKTLFQIRGTDLVVFKNFS